MPYDVTRLQLVSSQLALTLHCRHNERNGVSNTSLTIVYCTVYSGAAQRKHQSSASLAFVLGIHPWPVNSPHKRPVARNMFPFDDVIMNEVYGREVITSGAPFTIMGWFWSQQHGYVITCLVNCGWSYLSIPKLQQCNCWSLGMDT